MSSTSKLYHVHGFDSKKFLQTYFGACNVFEEDKLKFPVQNISNMVNSVFSTAGIKGGSVIDFSIGPCIHHLYPICKFFNDITLLRFSPRCIMELRKWLDSSNEAFDWSHISPFMENLPTSRDVWLAKELQLKKSIKQVLNVNLDRPNLTDPVVLPQADLVISAWILDNTSKNEEEYMCTLRKIKKLVKPGGYLILIGVLNATYFLVGQDRMQLFKHDDNFEKNALAKEGFTVTHSDMLVSKAVSDLTDYKAMSFTMASNNK